MTLRADDFTFFRTFLAERSGLNLLPEKTYLLESRLAPTLRQRNLDSLGSLARKLRAGGDVALEREVIEAMMTHETLFFRDLRIFDVLREQLLPELIAARQNTRRLSIWSAACSAGQEPYSIAMMLDEMAGQLSGWTIRILATDLSAAVIDRAKAGIFNQFEVQRGLPVRLLLKHFTQGPQGWTIEKRLRDMIEFRTFNLLNDAGMFGQFDLILCRNLMIYFDPPTRAGLFARLRRQIANDGALMLGGAETVLGATEDFTPTRDMPNFFRPSSQPAHNAALRSLAKANGKADAWKQTFREASPGDKITAWRAETG